MPDSIPRRSPIHDWLNSRHPQWHVADDVAIPAHFQNVEGEHSAAGTLGLCDLSGLAKLGIKGPGAESWLAEQDIEVPVDVYDSCRLADDTIVVRIAREEFLLESALNNRIVSTLAARLDPTAGKIFAVEHQNATFVLVGSRAIEVLAQTCGVDFRESPLRRLIFTRVAGVGCGVFPDSIGEVPAFRLWVDCSYALYLWEIWVQICEELGGRVIGAAAIFPELR